MKKTALMLASAVCSVFLMSTSAFATQNASVGPHLISSHRISSTSDGANLQLAQYDDNGKTVYAVTGAQTPSQRSEAMQILNSFMQSGSIATTNVYVTQYNQDFYGSEYSSNAGNAQGYTWAYYNAGNIQASYSNVDKMWGGSSAGWFGTGTASKIVLHQKSSINVTNASATLNISWPPGLQVTATSTTSTATWNSGEYTNANGPYGAQHDLVEFNLDDIHGGYVTSAVVNDSADVVVSGYTWKPSQYVRFIAS